MKTIDVNVIPEQVVKNTQLISKVGANVGTQIFKVEVRNAYPFATDQEFEAEKRKYETGEKKGFILNRSPRRLLAKNILIAGVCLVKDIDDELCLAINPKEDGSADMLLPVDNSAIDRLGKTDQEAIKAAIRGEKDSFFLDGKTLVKFLNALMQKDIENLESLKEQINKMITTLKGDIDSNEKKAKQAYDAWAESPLPVNIDMPSGVTGSNVHISVTEND